MELGKSLRKKCFPLLDGVYLNSAYMGPLPQRSADAAQKALVREQNPLNMPYSEWQNFSEQLRQGFAELIQWDSEGIATSTSTSEAISHTVLGFPWNPGDKVLLYDQEYPSDVLPFLYNEKRLGFDIEFKPGHYFLDPLPQSVPAKVRMLVFSAVRFHTGEALPLRDLMDFAEKHHLFTVVDITQALLASNLDLKQLQRADVVVCSSYKWLLSPYGHAFAAFSERALSILGATHAGWLSSPATYKGKLLDYTTDVLPGARRFDRGQAPNPLMASAVIESLKLLREWGVERVASHNLALAKFCVEQLPPHLVWSGHGDYFSSIVCFSGYGPELRALLQSQGVDVTEREGRMRASIHCFNSKEEIEQLLTLLHKARYS